MDEDEIPNRYDDSNRAFLQAFLARGTLTLKEAQPILAAIFTAHDKLEGNDAEPTRPNDVTLEDLESYISAASAAVSPLDMEIRAATHQVTRERVYALVNTTSDPVTQLATLYSPEETAFIKRVLDAMFDKYNTPRMETLCIDTLQANKLRAPPRISQDGDGDETQTQTQGDVKGIKSSEAETVLATMVQSGWFERSRAGYHSLSVRALLELRSWLVDAYNDPDAQAGEWQRVKFCEACREIVTVGQRCQERDCLVRLHDACAEALWRSARREKCPKCATAWSGRHFVGERAITETEAYRKGKRVSGKGRRGSRVEAEEEEEEEDGEDDGDEEDGEDE